MASITADDARRSKLAVIRMSRHKGRTRRAKAATTALIRPAQSKDLDTEAGLELDRSRARLAELWGATYFDENALSRVYASVCVIVERPEEKTTGGRARTLHHVAKSRLRKISGSADLGLRFTPATPALAMGQKR